jgi:hypothetical protein
MRPQTQAAIAYFVYGVVYMIGAVLELDDSRRRMFVGGHVPWWVFYAIGGLFVVGLPLLVQRGVRWVIALLALFTAAKALYLFYRTGVAFSPFQLFFALVALVAAVLLARAWVRTSSSSRTTPAPPPS